MSTLPDLSSEYEVSPESIAAYRMNGHVLLRDVCNREEAAAYRNVILDAAMKNNRETRPIEERDTYGKAFLQIMNLWEKDDQVKQFTLSKRFAGIAAKLLGVESVRLYHDQALFKEPGGGPTPWHQDQFYWPIDTSNTVTLWMPMINITAVMGSMAFADRSNENGFIEIDAQISDASEGFFDEYVRKANYSISGGGAMSAGDATFHSGYTLHRAPGNATDVTREVMTIIYYADGAKVTQPINSFQEGDRETWFMGLEPGSLAASERNPLL